MTCRSCGHENRDGARSRGRALGAAHGLFTEMGAAACAAEVEKELAM
jgi:hypothetical protein